MKIKIEELNELCMKILKSKCLSEEEAEIIFQEYLDGELRGRECHGFQAFPKFGAKLVDPKAKEEVIKEEDNLLYINGNGRLGQLVCNKWVPKLIEKAKKAAIKLSTYTIALKKKANLELEKLSKNLDMINESNVYEKVYFSRNCFREGLKGFMKMGYHSYKAQRIIKKDLPELTEEQFREKIVNDLKAKGKYYIIK